MKTKIDEVGSYLLTFDVVDEVGELEGRVGSIDESGLSNISAPFPPDSKPGRNLRLVRDLREIRDSSSSYYK